MLEQRPPRVLLVEDSPVQARTITTYLTAQGYPVEVASTVQEACTATTPVDVVVLDIVLPDGSGFEVLEHLRRERRSVKVLMLSQLGTLPDPIRGLKAGADDDLPKPFDLTELEARIQALWRQQHTQGVIKLGSWTIQSENL